MRPSLLEGRRCDWCRRPRPATRGARFCGQRCRQAAFRLRRRGELAAGPGDGPLRFAYADPPYPGTARKYYRDQADYAGEVDHAALVASLLQGGYAGWALSTSPRALTALLPLCPAGARVCAWVKPQGASPLTYGIHNCWEPVLVVSGRHRRPGVRDWLSALPARGGGQLPGRKPIAFCAWLFQLLGMRPGDELVDLFPGTGIVSAAWRELSLGTSATSSSDRVTIAVADDVADAGGKASPGSGRRGPSLVDPETASSPVDVVTPAPHDGYRSPAPVTLRGASGMNENGAESADSAGTVPATAVTATL